ncbi:hypothetical protein NBRC116602_08750 [Hyphomicrobiales bacterium 4NK60-0047b]
MNWGVDPNHQGLINVAKLKKADSKVKEKGISKDEKIHGLNNVDNSTIRHISPLQTAIPTRVFS